MSLGKLSWGQNTKQRVANYQYFTSLLVLHVKKECHFSFILQESGNQKHKKYYTN